ncbi:MAG: response regulator [Bacteroidales bacterium]|nr:response regulator [Bacteroidales bacterium]
MKTAQKILLVDDDIDILDVVETVLVNEGYQVITANNKEEAIAKAETEKPDLAIVDVMMTTHYEGFELAEALTKREVFKRLPVLMHTSIEVFESSDDDVMKFARYYRQNSSDKEMDVLLIQDYSSGNAGIDYRDEQGENHWLAVSGFIHKPASAQSLISAINRVLD